MIKIVTREHWRNLVDERNNAINELKEAQDDIATYRLETSQLMEENKAIGDQILDLEVKLDSKNAEIKKIRTKRNNGIWVFFILYKGGIVYGSKY